MLSFIYFLRKRLEYLVHWSGFNKEERTWELEGQLDNAHDIIIDFHRANPSAPWKLRMSYIDFLGLFKPYKNNTVTRDKDAPFDCLEVNPQRGGSVMIRTFSQTDLALFLKCILFYHNM